MEVFNLWPAHPILNVILLGILFTIGYKIMK